MSDEATAVIQMIYSALATTHQPSKENNGTVEVAMILTGLGAPNFPYRHHVERYQSALEIPVLESHSCNSWIGLNSLSAWNIAIGALEDALHLSLPLPKFDVFWNSIYALIEEIFHVEIQGKEVAVLVGHSVGGLRAAIMTLFYPHIRAVTVGAPFDLTAFPALNRLALRSLRLPDFFRSLAKELGEELNRTGATERIYRCKNGCDDIVPDTFGEIPAKNIFHITGLPWESETTHTGAIGNPAAVEAAQIALYDYRLDKQMNGHQLAAA